VAGAAGAGQLSAALKLIFALLMLDRALNALLLPVMSRYASTRPGDLPALIGVVGRTTLLVGLPITVLGIILAPWLVPLVFGAGYGEAVLLFQILLPYVGMTLLSSTYVVVLLAAGKERLYTRLMLAATGILVVLVVVLTVMFGPAGAAWGVLGGEACALVLLARAAHTMSGVPPASILVRPIAVSLPMIACLLLPPLVAPPAAAAIALALFLAALLIAGKGGRSDFRYLRERFL
jgi:O-antigen/teichoic acid export membrane protein